MLGMTETGSVCLMSPDESDLPERYRGSFGKPVPELEARVVNPDTLDGLRARRAGGAVVPGAAAHGGVLRPRAPRGVHRRRLVPHRRRLHRRRRGLLLLPRSARRHDQDRGRQRVAARGRGGPPRRHRRRSSRSCSGSTTPNATRSSPRSSSPPADVALDVDGLPAVLRDQALGVQGAARDPAGSPPTRFRCSRAASPTWLDSVSAPWPLTGSRCPRSCGGGRRDSPDHRVRRHPGRPDHLRRARRRDPRASPRDLVARGIGKGTRVGLLMSNGVDWAVIASALARVGAVLVPLSTLLRPPELEAQLRVAGVDTLVSNPSSVAATTSPTSSVADRAAAAAPRRRSPGVELGRPSSASSPHPAELVDALDAPVRPADDLVDRVHLGQPRRHRRA